MQSFFELMFWLLVGHALADWAIQGYYLSEAKNRNTEIGKTIWGWGLFYHALIHGGFVAYATGSVMLGCAELVAHAGIDYLKCEKKIGIHADQLLHIACKVMWAAITLYNTPVV